MKKTLFFFLLLLSSCYTSYAISVNHTVDEDVLVVQLLTGDYILRVNGDLTITNPTVASEIYEYIYTVDLLPTVYGNFNDQDSLSTVDYLGFSGYEFAAGTQRNLRYSFSGTLNTTEFNELDAQFQNGTSFLEIVSDVRYVTRTSINVDKPIREFENTTNNSRRAVGARVSNPTEFDVTILDLEIYRTNITDVFIDSGTIVGKEQNMSIGPFSNDRFDFYDINSSSVSVYWLKSIVSANWEWDVTFDYEFVVQQPPNIGGGGGGGSSGGSSSPGTGNDDIDDSIDQIDLLSNLVIKKDVDKVFVSQGEEITVYLKVLNLGEDTLYNISFTDEIPQGYVLKSISGAEINGNTLSFNIAELEGYGEVNLEYVLEKVDSVSSLTFFKPVKYDGDATLEGVLVVENLLGNAKLFVQKEIEWVDERFSRVTITIKNVGDGVVNNFKLIDVIEDRYILKDILKAFDQNRRGEWVIDELAPGDEWKVNYLVESHEAMGQLPLLVGVEESNVYGTVILDSQIHTEIKDASSLVEKIGFGVTIFLVLVYFLF